MADYKERAITGKSWQRCNCVTITNPRGGQPTVRMSEETVAVVDGDAFVHDAQGFEFPFNPAEVIKLRNPNNGKLNGATITGMEVYVALYSLYLQKAAERDAAG